MEEYHYCVFILHINLRIEKIGIPLSPTKHPAKQTQKSNKSWSDSKPRLCQQLVEYPLQAARYWNATAIHASSTTVYQLFLTIFDLDWLESCSEVDGWCEKLLNDRKDCSRGCWRTSKATWPVHSEFSS